MQRSGQVALILVLLPFVLPLALFAIASHIFYPALLYLLVWALWLPKGKDVLLVYSDSPIWHEYMTTQILPLVQERAVVLNWSERKKWPRLSLAVAVFHHFGGAGDFNPLVVLFKPLRMAYIYRFWSAFKDWKRGYQEPVERITQELVASLQLAIVDSEVTISTTIEKSPSHSMTPCDQNLGGWRLLPVFVAAFVVCFVSASIVNVLHFQMKFRLRAAGLKVTWFMMPWDDFRMWRTYMSAAPIRRWPVWPFYVYRVLMVVFLLSGVIALFTVNQLGALLPRQFRIGWSLAKNPHYAQNPFAA